MGLLTNPNDVEADVYDIAEAIRRNGGYASIKSIVKSLNISEKRAIELTRQAAPNGQYSTRVYQDTNDKLFKLRY